MARGFSCCKRLGAGIPPPVTLRGAGGCDGSVSTLQYDTENTLVFREMKDPMKEKIKIAVNIAKCKHISQVLNIL